MLIFAVYSDNKVFEYKSKPSVLHHLKSAATPRQRASSRDRPAASHNKKSHVTRRAHGMGDGPDASVTGGTNSIVINSLGHVVGAQGRVVGVQQSQPALTAAIYFPA